MTKSVVHDDTFLEANRGMTLSDPLREKTRPHRLLAGIASCPRSMDREGVTRWKTLLRGLLNLWKHDGAR